MKSRFQKQLHPGAVAVIIIAVLVIVQYAWWRGLVYRPPLAQTGGGGGPPPPGPEAVVLVGRADIKVETYAGDLEPGFAEGSGYAARFDRPTGLAVDGQGNLYVADTGNNRIRKISPDSQTTTVAGGDPGYRDGPTAEAQFNAPCGVCAAPDGAVYVADTGNHCIRCIRGGQVTTTAGSPPGTALQAAAGKPLVLPTGIAFLQGAKPALIVADPGAKSVRRYRLDGTLESEQILGGPPTSAIDGPIAAVAIPQAGTLRIGAQTLHDAHVDGGKVVPALKRYEPCLRHPAAVAPFGSGFLVLDNDHGAVFFVQNGKVEVLAGFSYSGGPMRGIKDGTGAKCSFSTLGGVAADGTKFVYVADTDNNTIRRLTMAGSVDP